MTAAITKGKIFKEDMGLYANGSDITGTRKTSTGGVQTLTRFDWVGVDVYAVYGSRTGAAISAAIGNLNSAKRQIFLSPGAWTLGADLTIPATVHLYMAEGAQIDGAFTLTINGRFRGFDDPFGSSLTVAWGANAVGTYVDSGALVVKGTLTASGIGEVFVNNSNGDPNLSDTQFDVDSNVTESAWESFGPTGSGADNVWTALDGVPSGVSWIEIRARMTGTSAGGDTPGAALSLSLYARKNGSSETAGVDNVVAAVGWYVDASGFGRSYGAFSGIKIPVASGCKFDLQWFGDNTGGQSIEIYLTGYGYNP